MTDCIRRYDRPHTFFFMDPPYWETEGYGVTFGWEQYEQLASMLRKLKGKAMVTLNDHPAIRPCSLASTSNRLTSRTPLAAEAVPHAAS